MKKKIILLILISLSISGLIFAYSKGMLPGMYDKNSGKRPYDYPGSKWKCEELQMEVEVPEDFIEEKDARLYGTMIDNNEEIRVGSYVSPVYDVPTDKSEFDVHIKLAHHNLARGLYRVGFNIGHKEIAYGLRDYDVVHPVLLMEVVNSTKDTPIVLWQKQWGSTNYHDAEIVIE